MVFNKLVRIRVGTDVSRPRWQSTAEKDVRHRSLQATYPDYFVKPHYHVLVRVSRLQEDVRHRSLQRSRHHVQYALCVGLDAFVVGKHGMMIGMEPHRNKIIVVLARGMA